MKVAVNQIITNKKANLVRVFVLAGLVMFGLASCKGGEDCGAYQGSHKSTRSHKAKKRYSEVKTLPVLSNNAC
ncbi:MAG: hypothetical protein ACRCYO_04835 [Bacteroidia bacterium]